MPEYVKKSDEEIYKKKYEQAINSNIRLVDENKILMKENDGLKMTIKSAIQYMKENKKINVEDSGAVINFYKTLLSLLKGEIL